MAEQITLTSPVTPPTLSSWRVLTLVLHRGEVPAAAFIDVRLRGTNGELFTKTYVGLDANAMLSSLNVANLSVKSLERRVLERLVADGVLVGGISGTPD